MIFESGRSSEDTMFKVSDLGASYCEIRDVEAPSSNNDQENTCNISMINFLQQSKEAGFSSNDGDDQHNIELPREKKLKKNNPETEADSPSDHSCFVSHVTPSSLHTDALHLSQDFTSTNGIKRKCGKKDSQRQIISSYSSSDKLSVSFTLAPVDVRNCRLRLPMQFTRENGIKNPGKIYLLGKDGSKWLANLLLESRGRMTLGDGWKSFVKANGLKTGESFTLKLNWEDTTPVLSLCPANYSTGASAVEHCSVASEKEFLPIEPSSEKKTKKDDNNKDENSVEENNKEENSSWERENTHLRYIASTSLRQNRFLTLTITRDSFTHCRLRIPLQFMMENSMNKPGEITLIGKDGAKWLVSLLRERRGRMNLGKRWKDFAKANSFKTGDSITLESIWEDATPVLRLLRIESSSGMGKSEFTKESLSTEPSNGNKTKKAENNKEKSRKYPPTSRDSSSAIQSRFVTLTHPPELVWSATHDVRIGEVASFRYERDMMFQVSDLGPSCCEIQNIPVSSSNNDHDSFGSILMKIYPHLRKGASFSSYDGDDLENFEHPKRKKVKKNNPETEADSSSDHSCLVAHVATSSLHTDALYLQQDFTSSNGIKRKCVWKNGPRQIISSYSSCEKQFITFTLAPVDVRNCRLRLPMQFTRENGINKPGKIYLLGKDGSKWLANLLLESRGRMTLGDGWKSFVKANGLKTGESFTFKLNWEDTTPMLSLCPAEYITDTRAETRHKESLPIEPSRGKEISKDDNKKDENIASEKNHLQWRNSTSLNQNRYVTLTITPDSLKHGRLRLPLQFMKENSINKPGEITLLGKDGAKWLVSLLLERRGRMSLGKGWKDFAKANGLKTGDSITLQPIWEDATPVLSFLRIESSSDRGKSEFPKESHSAELRSGNKTRNAENNKEESSSRELEKRQYLPRTRDYNRFLTLTLTPKYLRDCNLHLPCQFLRNNGINKPGKITLLGRSGMKWFAYLMSTDGTVAMGNGWKGFCEANGVMLGESFILEFIHKEDTNYVFKFCFNSEDQLYMYAN